MSSLKCSQCGLVNFSSAIECKRCQNPISNSISAPSQVRATPYPNEHASDQSEPEIYWQYATVANSPIEAESSKSNRILPAAGIIVLLFALSLFVKTMILTKKADLATRRDNTVSAQTISDSSFNNQEVNDNRNQVDNNSNKLVVNNSYQETAKPSLVDTSIPNSTPMPMPSPDTISKSTVKSANTSGSYFVEYSAPTPKPQGVFQRLSVPTGSANTGQTPSTTQREPMTVSGGVLNGKATNLVKPQYSDAARAIRVTGIVNVQVTIDVDGNVISANAVSGHPMLKQSAEYAARASKFNPTILSGEKVKVAGVLVYNFTPQ